MPSARAALRPDGAPSAKRRFAKRAPGFVKRAPGFPMLWIGGISAAIAMILRGTGHLPTGKRKAAAAPGQGLLARARVAPEALAAIEAEDHYCRVHRKDGGDALIHYRFGDALAEVAEIEGAQVHRGSWVAADAVTGAEREGRRWLLVLSDGTKVAVSPPHLAEARRRGWLTAPART